MNESNEVGRRVRDLRISAKIDAQHLSRACGFSPSVVWCLENGRIANPSAELIVSLAEALGTQAEYLCRGKGDPPTAERVLAAFIRLVSRKRDSTAT
jgi:transcriptional regulator with XRE-family HTH domain